MSQMIEELWRDDPITISDVAVTLGEIAESFDGGEYAISDETRRALIDFAHGIPDHPLFAVVGHYFAQNPVPGATQPAARRVTDAERLLTDLVNDMEALIGESSGVYGLHLNGDPSPWAELLPGGRFERFSTLYDAGELVKSFAQPAEGVSGG